MIDQVKRFSNVLAFVLYAIHASPSAQAQAPIEVGFLWHMHQPIYYPYETITQTQANAHFSFSVVDVHNQRLGPYTGWPRDAIDGALYALPAAA